MTVHEQLCTPEGVQAIAKECWDCAVTAEMAETLSAKYIKHRKKPMEDSFRRGTATCAVGAGQLVWLKDMLNEMGLLPISDDRASDDTPTPVTAVLHVGFMTIFETEEMVCRLHNEELCQETNRPARSKMFATAQKQTVTPIDATAGIVAHTSQESN